MDKNAAAGFFDLKGMALFAIFMGMAVGCKLYAAALALLFIIVVAHWYPGMFGRAKTVLAIAFVFALSLAVFVAGNPLLYTDFFSGMRCLTSAHLNRHGGHAALYNYPSLRYLIIYPFILFRPVVFTMNQSINFVVLQMRDYLFALGGYALLIAGLRQRSGKLEYSVLAWGVSIFSMIGFVLLSLPAYAVYTRIFLLPSIALIWIISFMLSRGEQG
ncbi:MAG: hypothetical protein KJ893_04465 [Candidatus Omnitrophica bacterium]|nr:hypothetical protein [Candidatus Omnitrophota bacterium]MBU4477632.1 hypothetical protein [Candidatus Omnitrophota bacterium]MCG2704308.1 hypothetical protein [Candidatus Omnitrophota bacterium]